MWLRRLVGVVMIITCIGLNALVLIGFFSPVKVSKVGFTETALPVPPPVVSITAKPNTTSAGNFSALSWSATGNPDNCSASDAWTGVKTPFGSESTGRIPSPGTYTYTLTCTNKGGTAKVSAIVAVGAAAALPPAAPKTSYGNTTVSTTASYCGGASPCYGPHDVAAHKSSGNCWGWNGNRVINISGLDAGFHVAKSGISSIEINQVCGKDLAPALGGSVGADGQPGRNHNPTTKANADSNVRPYFVGYFDNSKP